MLGTGIAFSSAQTLAHGMGFYTPFPHPTPFVYRPPRAKLMPLRLFHSSYGGGSVSEIFLSLRFGRWLLASGQDGWRSRGCSFWQAAKTGGRRTGVTFGRQPTQVFGRLGRRPQRVIGIFDWKDWRKKGRKKSAESGTRHDHLAGNIHWAERWRFRRAVWNRC